MSTRVYAWTAFGLLFASGAVWWSWSDASERRMERWTSEPPRISREVPGPPRPAQQNPAPTSLIRSVEVARPGPVELTVIASPPPEPSVVAEPPPQCEVARPLALLRAGCLEAPPNVLPCSDEGLECRYATAADCVARYECLYGLWSPLELACPDAEQGQLLAGSGRCEEHTPVADAPCAQQRVPLASSGDLDLFVASFSAQGNLRYSFRLGSAGQDGVNDIAARPGGGWLIPFYLDRPIALLAQEITGGEHLLWIDEP